MNVDLKEVIVIGGSHQNAIGVIRALGRKGIKSFFILISHSSKSFINRSRYLSGHISLMPQQVVSSLLENKCEDGKRKVIIACHDEIVELLDTHRKELEQHFILPGTEDGLLQKLLDKQYLTLDAKNFGFTVPASFSTTDGFNIDDVQFPCITKPWKSHKGSKSHIKRFEDNQSLSQFLKENNGKEFQIQQFIDVDFEYQLIGASYKFGDEVVIPGVSIILRPYNGSNTEFLHYRRLTADFNNVVALVKQYLKDKRYSGLFSAEFLRGSDGKDYFMEINFRNDGNTISVTNAGANLPYWWVMKNSGVDVALPEVTHDQYLLPEHRELSLWRKGIITTKELRSDWKLATCYSKYASDDKWPTYGKLSLYFKVSWACVSRLYNILSGRNKRK